MAGVNLKLDSAGIRSVLNSGQVRSAVHGAAESIAGNVRASVAAGTDVVVDNYTTDRAASSVTIRDSRGRLWQVRDGVMTRAASAAGLQVKAR